MDQTELHAATCCKSCGCTGVEENYLFPLCKDCRDNLVSRAVPRWIKVMFTVVMLIALFSILKFPRALSTGIAYEKGVNAEQSKHYITAMRQYQTVLSSFPQSAKIQARLFITYYHNQRMKDAETVLKEISGESPDDTQLTEQVNTLIQDLDTMYYPSSQLESVLKSTESDQPIAQAAKLKAYLTQYPKDYLASYCLASILYDLKQYDEAQELCSEVIRNKPGYTPGQLLMAAIYREKSQYDLAVECCNTVLKDNFENPYAFTALSKIELKRHQDKLGLELAQKAYNLENDDAAVITNLALAYHLNGMEPERNKTVDILKTLPDREHNLNFLNQVFNGQIQWRS